MTRLPLRWRVTAAFALTLLVVLAAVGVFLYLRFDAALTETLDRGLRARAGEATALVRRSPTALARAAPSGLEADESVAQVLRADGTVLAGTAPATASLLTPAQVERALRADVRADRPGDARLDEGTRLLAVPVSARGERLVVVVGASSDEKAQSLSTLLALEVVGLGAALLLASGAGYLVAGLALRPVEAMRRQADAIGDQPDRRLPVGPVDDELGRLGVTLNAMLGRLERAQAAEREALAKERRFVANASHELRTPLTVLKSEIEVALLEALSVEGLQAALRSAGEEADRLIRLAEDLLVLARSDHGRLSIRPSPVALRGLLEQVAARHRATVIAGGRTILVEASADLVAAVDAARLEQAVANLTDNALRHGAGDVRLVAATAGDAVCITVRDHGLGIEAAFADRAFERFSRADAGRTGGGAGLGLAITRAIALAHGGDVTLADARPGVAVTLTLPHRPLIDPTAA